MSQVTEQSVRFQTALASIKLIQASAVLDLTEDDFDFLTSNKVWIARSEERFSRNAETDLVCRLLLEKKKRPAHDAVRRLDAGRRDVRRCSVGARRGRDARHLCPGPPSGTDRSDGGVEVRVIDPRP